MKKLLLAGLMVSVPFFVQADNEDLKKSYSDKCKKEFRSKMNVQISDEDLQQFCDCNADKIFAKFTAEEIKKMDETLKNGTVAEKQAVNEKITPVVMPCFNDIQTKIK